MREEVLRFFRTLPESEVDQFNKGLMLYMRSEGKNLSTERNLNQTGYTKHSLANLMYDLQKMYAISDIEKLPVEAVPVKKLGPVLGDDSDSLTNTGAGPETENTDQGNTSGDDNGDTDPGDEDTGTAPGHKIKVVNPETVTEGENPEFLTLRQQYPFLNDPDCPNELKILVADKLTDYNRYKQAHAQLQEIKAGTLVVSAEEQTAIAETATIAFRNNEKITRELDYYLAEKKFLGEHPMFGQLKIAREVEAMTQDELLKFKEQTPSYISKKNKALKKVGITEIQKQKIEGAILDRNAKLALVNKKLGVAK